MRLFQSGQFAAAAELAGRAVTLLRQRYGAQSNDLALGLSNLALMLNRAGRSREALAPVREAIRIWEERRAKAHAATGYGTLGQIQLELGELTEAEASMRNALALRLEVFGNSHADVALSLADLAAVLESLGQFEEAETTFRRALAMREALEGANSAAVAQTLGNYGLLKQKTGDFRGAESLYQRALGIYARLRRSSHPDALAVGVHLGLLYQESGRADEAVGQLERALKAYVRIAGDAHPAVAKVRNNLGLALMAAGRFEDAARMLEQALTVYLRALGSDHADVAQLLNNLGLLRIYQGQPRQALAHLERALTIRRNGRDTPPAQLAESLANLGSLELLLNRHAAGERNLAEAARLFRRSLGDSHPNLVRALGNWGAAQLALGHQREALATFREIAKLIDARPWLQRPDGLAIPSQLAETGALALQPARVERGYLKMYLQALAANLATDAGLLDEAFLAAQRAIDNPASAALSQLAERFANGRSRVAPLVKQLQIRLIRQAKLDRDIILAGNNGPGAAGLKQAADSNRAELAGLQQRIQAIDPRFVALAAPQPMPIEEARQRLGADDALVMFVDAPGAGKVPSEAFAFVVTKTAARLVRLKLTPAVLARQVKTLRCGLDFLGEWREDGQCAKLLGRTFTAEDFSKGRLLPFDLEAAHELYRALFADFEGEIAGKTLFVVSSGALSSLPLHVLLTEAAGSRFASSTPAYQRLPWLARRHAISVLPSVTSLQVLQDLPASAASQGLAAFANPLLDGDPQVPAQVKAAAEARRQQRCGIVANPANDRLAQSRIPLELQASGGLADPAALRRQLPLPETADEICEIAKRFAAAPEDIHLGQRMSETALKAADLARYRVLHFATHAALSGEITGTAEPGLIFTPPTTASPVDDGFLAASEIAGLNLDAEMVVLSACNTAGAQTPGAEPLSGLARAFFYARARGLLVSHWYVNSQATVALMTRIFDSMPNEGRHRPARALTVAMLDMIDGGGWPAHPSYWAAFVLVGGGGHE